MRIPTSQQIRELEKDWIEAFDAPWGQVLMEIAGRGSAMRALKMWQESPGDVVVLCGTGNNGGDGLVVARYLTLWGVPVTVCLIENKSENGGSGLTQASKTGQPKSVRAKSVQSKSAQAVAEPEVSLPEMSTAEGRVNLNIIQKMHVPIKAIDPATMISEHRIQDGDSGTFLSDPLMDQIFFDTTLVIDAIFGTGLKRDVEGVHRRVIEAVNRSGKRVLALDVPSGINSDTGQICGAAIRADETVTFGYLKPGLLCYPGNNYKGHISIVDIGLPEIPDGLPDINLSTIELVREMAPIRPADAHKGSFGHVLVVAGSTGMAGAATLAGISAMRTGAGLLYLATPKSMAEHISIQELICKPMPETESGSLSKDAVKKLKKHLEIVNAVIIGPGLSTEPETVEAVCQILSEIHCPCVVDADALNALATKEGEPGSYLPDTGEFVLTPHPKELSRLLKCSVEDIQKDRIKAAIDAAKKFNAIVVLKGAMTVIANWHEEVFINPTGNPGMATAGAGDVLAGIIGGLLAQKVDPMQAAILGTYIHGRAGDLLCEQLGDSGIIASDLQQAIPIAVQSIKNMDRSRLEEDIMDADAS